MSRPDQAFPSEEKGISRVQNIVLRHLYLLLGYNSTEKFFHQTPDVLRTSTVFNVFMANLPQLLDQNNLMGFTMLPIVMQVLLYSPNPNSNALTNTEAMQNASYTYSLWYLEPHVRRNWLLSVLVILYKYQYTQLPFSQNVNSLVRIVLNSLESQFHQCKRIPATVIMDTMTNRSRDVSLPSLGPESDKMQETPPTSPIFRGETSNTTPGNNVPRAKPFIAKGRKYTDSSLDADDTESELVAIPESDFSDSTLHGSSAPGSFDDPLHFDDICAPLKPEIMKNRATAMVTSANLATAHVALSTLTTADHRREETLTKRTHKTITITKNGDNVRTTTTLETTTVKTEPKDVSNVTEKAILAPPANVQRTIVVTQKPAATEDGKSTPDPPILSWVEQKISSPVPRPLGRQKRIIEASITPASSPNSVTDQNSPNSTNDKVRRSMQLFDSPDELSKMNIMSPPSSENMESLMSPKSVHQLEIPTQERLLPIGPPGKDNITHLVERVREALTIPNISHLKQESLEISESSTKDESIAQHAPSRTTSPRRLTKQTALIDSPPLQNAESPLDLHAALLKAVGHEPKERSKAEQLRPQRQRLRKIGPFAIDSIQIPDSRLKFAGSWQPSNYKADEFDGAEDVEESNVSTSNENRPGSTSNRVGEDTVVDRCSECGAPKEEYGDEEIGILMIILGTFIHREPQLAAPFMPEILMLVSKFASQPAFPWQYESSTHLPGGSQSVAHQFIRCALHQLAPNGVFVQIFFTQAHGEWWLNKF